MKVPRFVVFEGPDGVGKTTFVNQLKEYYLKLGLTKKVHVDWFPGKEEGSLGDLVYKLHHTWKIGEDVDPVALQLMHIAAHVDNIRRKFQVWFKNGDYLILDRFWWSTYAYGRLTLTKRQVWKIVDAERQFWVGVPKPVFIYMTRPSSFKPGELNKKRFDKLKKLYQEVVNSEKSTGAKVHIVVNGRTKEETFKSILKSLGLLPGV